MMKRRNVIPSNAVRARKEHGHSDPFSFLPILVGALKNAEVSCRLCGVKMISRAGLIEDLCPSCFEERCAKCADHRPKRKNTAPSSRFCAAGHSRPFVHPPGIASRTRRILVHLFVAILFTLTGKLHADDEPWAVASRSPEITVYERTRKGSTLREFKAVGIISAPPAVIKRVIDDVDQYTQFMPYVTEARVISRDGANLVSYQRISPPFVGDRDYTLRVNCVIRRGAAGTSYCNSWRAANDLGPLEQPGVSRVKITEGSWLIEPDDRGRKTRATYHIFSDSGGALPAAIANAASRSAIPKMFESIKKQAQLAKYLRAQ